MARLGTIAIREDRTLTVGPFDDLPSGAESWDYIVAFRATKSGADLTSVTFGTGQRSTNADGEYIWTVSVPSAKTALLTAGVVHVAVWRTGSGVETLVNDANDTVTVIDRPGNAS